MRNSVQSVYFSLIAGETKEKKHISTPLKYQINLKAQHLAVYVCYFNTSLNFKHQVLKYWNHNSKSINNGWLHTYQAPRFCWAWRALNRRFLSLTTYLETSVNNNDIIKYVIQLVPRRKRSIRARRIRESFPGKKIKPSSELYKMLIEVEKKKKGSSDWSEQHRLMKVMKWGRKWRKTVKSSARSRTVWAQNTGK